MSDDRVRTRVCTSAGEFDFQTYFVKRRARDKVISLRFEGASEANPAPGVIEAIAAAEAIVLCPSNPFISIGPILAVPGNREALQHTRERVVAISPIVGGRALKGPAAHMMKSMQNRSAAAEVARMYADFVGTFVLDRVDQSQAALVEKLGMRAIVTNTIMRGLRERKSLARVVLRTMEIPS
jgi:LPPG:FO 2-phospho-L-lactate transferase